MKANKSSSSKDITPKRGRGRPEFVPTEHDRRQVNLLSGMGLPYEQIAVLMGPKGIHVDTLRRHFGEELARGKAEATSKVCKTALRVAMSGEVPSVLIFWLKARAGWSDRGERPAEGQQLPAQADDLTVYTADELKILRDIMRKAEERRQITAAATTEH